MMRHRLTTSHNHRGQVVGLSESADKWCGASVSVSNPSDDTIQLVRSPRAVGRAVAQSSPPQEHGAATATGGPVHHASEEALSRRRKLRHDIQHELATIMLLASLLDDAPDVGPESRRRARQILGEARWLDHLQRAYDGTFAECDEVGTAVPELVRLDVLACEAVDAVRLSTSTRIGFSGREAWTLIDRLAFWRAVRNMVGNAVRAAGPDGRVEVSVERGAGRAVVQVDDDGPGFGAAPAGRDSLGLEIVREFAVTWNGHLEICRSNLGGCCVRLRVWAASPSESAAEL
jgi:signal transduction histidine kinase